MFLFLFLERVDMKKNRVFIVVFGLFCVVIFLTVGYSAFLDDLSIASSTARAREYRDIMVTGVTSSTSGATVTNLDYDPDSIFNEATLSQNGTITYTVTVKNLGEDPMAIYSIDTSGLPSDLRIVSTSGYDFTNKEKICDDDNSSLCTLNATRTITIVIGYNNYVSDSTVYNINIGFEFVKIYDVTYNNITVGNNYPTHAYHGKTFTVTFQNDIPYAVELSQNFQKTYSNNTLTVQNPTSGFAINRYYHITYNLDGGTQAANQPDRYLAGNSVTLLDPTKTDYTFGGWYDNSSFTGSAITSTNGRSGDLVLYAKWTSSGSGGGMGTPENPYEDTTTQTYDPHNVPANSTIIYTAVEGSPQVSTDEDGNITDFEFTNVSSSNPLTVTENNTIDTGFIPFDGSSDWELNMRYRWDWNDNTDDGSTVTTTLSCMDWSSGSLSSGFGIRHSAKKATSTSNVPKTNLFLNVSSNDTSSTFYLFNTTSSGRIYTDPMDLTVHITKIGSNMTFSITANGSFKYNPTRDSSSTSNGAVTTKNETITKTWQDNNSTSNMDIKIGGYLSSSGSVAQKANIDVLEFSVHKISN